MNDLSLKINALEIQKKENEPKKRSKSFEIIEKHESLSKKQTFLQEAIDNYKNEMIEENLITESYQDTKPIETEILHTENLVEYDTRSEEGPRISKSVELNKENHEKEGSSRFSFKRLFKKDRGSKFSFPFWSKFLNIKIC